MLRIGCGGVMFGPGGAPCRRVFPAPVALRTGVTKLRAGGKGSLRAYTMSLTQSHNVMPLTLCHCVIDITCSHLSITCILAV